MNQLNKKAYTMVELVIAFSLMTILVSFLGAGLVQNYAVFQTNNIVNTFQNDARLAIGKLSSELRRTSISQISISKDTPSTGTDTLTFYLPSVDSDNDPVVNSGTISWSTDSITISVNNNNLIRTDATGSTILAKNLKAITFSSINQDSQLYIDELKFTLEFQTTGHYGRTHTYKTTSVVNMRN